MTMPNPDLDAAVARLRDLAAAWRPYIDRQASVAAIEAVLAAVAWPTPPALSGDAQDVEALLERLLSDNNDELVIGRSAGAFYARMHGDLSPRRSRETLADALRALADQIERAAP